MVTSYQIPIKNVIRKLRCSLIYIILIYDIKNEDNGCKVQRKVFKICKRYLTHIQNSVFEGELSPSQLFNLKKELSKILRSELDSCIIFNNKSSKWLNKEFLTKEIDHQTQFI